MNKLDKLNRESEEQHIPLWLVIFYGMGVIGIIAILLVQFFISSSP